MVSVRYELRVHEDEDGRFVHRFAVDDDGPVRPRVAMAALGAPDPALGRGVEYAVGRGATPAQAVHRWIAWVAGVPPSTSGLIVAIADWLGLTRQAWDRALSRTLDVIPRRRGASAETIAQRLGLVLMHVPGQGERAWFAVHADHLPESMRAWLNHPLHVGLVVTDDDAAEVA